MTRAWRSFSVSIVSIGLAAAGCGGGRVALRSGDALVARGDDRLACAVEPTLSFTVAELWGQVGAERGTDGGAEALRRWLAEPGSRHGLEWRRASETGTEVLFVAGDGATMPAFVATRSGGGEWSGTGPIECRPRRVRGGALAGTWTTTDPVSASTTRVSVHVREQGCVSGSAPGDRVGRPDVRYADDAVTLTFFVAPPPQALDVCTDSSESTTVVVTLAEPLGRRALVDGGAYPARTVADAVPGGVRRCVGEPGGPTDLDAEPWAPAEYQHRWTDARGCLVRIDVLSTSAPGPDFHCAPWPPSLSFGTPLGQPSTASRTRTYVGDFSATFVAPGVEAGFDGDVASPPADLVDTGYTSWDAARLLVDPDDDAAVYLHYRDRVERWPRMAGVGCG